MARKPIQAAGGIVVRSGARPLVAVVQRSKDERWVLPRGKLERNEDPAAGARREAVEETGHRVKVHEFLGAITYRTSGRPKVVQFWRMHAAARPSRDVMKDILAVEWLPLSAAVRRLTYPLEKLFLQSVGRRVLKRHRRKAARRKTHTAQYGATQGRSQDHPQGGKGASASAAGAQKNRGAAEGATAVRQSARRQSTHSEDRNAPTAPEHAATHAGPPRALSESPHARGVAAILSKSLAKI